MRRRLRLLLDTILRTDTQMKAQRHRGWLKHGRGWSPSGKILKRYNKKVHRLLRRSK